MALEELQARADELNVLVQRARVHLEEVHSDNQQRENTARLNYLDFIEKSSKAREEAEREEERVTGRTRCHKCGGWTDEPGGMTSDDSYSQFRCPFHKV
jgi:hypothetical protein